MGDVITEKNNLIIFCLYNIKMFNFFTYDPLLAVFCTKSVSIIYYTNYTFIRIRCLTCSVHMTPEPTSDASKKSRVCENAIAHNTTTTINY